MGRAGASQHPVENKITRVMEYVVPAFLFCGWILLLACTPATDVAGFSIYPIAWCLYMGFAANLCRLRGNARAMREMEGDYLTDFCSALTLYPLVCTQLGEEVDVNGPLLPKQA